jgi:DNA primase
MKMKNMNNGKQHLSTSQAKEKDLVDYLTSLGYKPAKILRNDYWYLSPLRDENTASFKINRLKNVWYDHGLGKGGNLIDFGILYHKCSVKELLEKLGSDFYFHQPIYSKTAVEKPEENRIKVISEGSLNSLTLLRYFMQRRIDESIARNYCREVLVEVKEKRFSAIGFRSDKGGFELRNSFFKGSCSPKAVTTFDNGSKSLSVFEGFFDFLSHQTIHRNTATFTSNFLILNSAAFFEKARPLMEKYDRIHLFLDADKTGQLLTQKALGWSNKYSDQSSLYKGYKDLNEWIQQVGKSQRQGLRPY